MEICVTQFRKLFYCLQCNKKIADGSCASNILKCHYCNLAQKRNQCKEKCHVYVKVSQDDSQFAITFFHEEIEEICKILCQKLTRRGTQHRNCWILRN